MLRQKPLPRKPLRPNKLRPDLNAKAPVVTPGLFICGGCFFLGFELGQDCGAHFLGTDGPAVFLGDIAGAQPVAEHG